MKQATYIGKAVSTNSNSREYELPTMQSTPSQTNTTHFPPPKEKMAQESYSIYGVYFPTNRPTQNMRNSNILNPLLYLCCIEEMWIWVVGGRKQRNK